MPSWNEYKAIATERGALAMELYVVESVPANGAEGVREHLAAHLAYQKQIETDGGLVMAGPLSDDTGELMEGAGLIVYRAAGIDAARRLANGDPMHAQGARTYRLRRWLVNEGRMTFEVTLSTQSVRLPGAG